MSFYSVSNPSNFAVQNQGQQAAKQIQFLKNGFQQPFKAQVNSVSYEAETTYSADDLVNNRFISRDTDSEYVFDYLPNAVDILAALNNNQWVKRDNQLQQDTPVQPGFYFDFTVHLQDNGFINLYGNDGVELNCGYDVEIYSYDALNFRANVIDTTPGNEYIIVTLITFPACWYFDLPNLASAQSAKLAAAPESYKLKAAEKKASLQAAKLARLNKPQ